MSKAKLKLPSGTTGFTNDAGKWICTGSQMGRRNELPDNRNEAVKLRMERLEFVDGDYDALGGAYWGAPANVWCAWGDASDYAVRVFVRADSRDQAKGKVREQLPNARFYR